MLREEREWYQDLLQTMDHYRGSILLRLFNGELPKVMAGSVKATSSEEDIAPAVKNPVKHNSTITTPEQQEQDRTKIRFIRPTPCFIWKDMKKYGPYDSGEETEIYPEVADLLVRKGRAEKVT